MAKKVGLTLEGVPNKKQEKFFKANKKHIAYGGARGGGKSWAMRRKFVLLALAYDNLNLLILRRTMPELRANHINPLIAEIGKFAQYKQVENVFIFPNGSRINLGYCATDADWINYQGHEYDVIGLEEATNFTEYQAQMISTSLRAAKKKVSIDGFVFEPRIYYTANPGGVGHAWFKRLFIDREYRNNEKSKDYTFIQADVYDNKILMKNDPNYVNILENLPEELRRAHLYGDWDAFAGQYFREWRREVHTIDPFRIPDEWDRYVTIDYGLDMLAAYWIAVDKQENAYVYKELYQSNLIISEAAKRILEINGDDLIDTFYGPIDLWNRRNDTGKSAFEIFNENGVYLMKSSRERINGWYAVKEYLKINKSRDEQTGDDILTSRLKFFNTCDNIIRCLPQLQSDKRNPNDVAKDPHELTHGPDAIRGFCIERQMLKLPKTKEQKKRARVRLNTIENFAAGEATNNFLNYGG